MTARGGEPLRRTRRGRASSRCAVATRLELPVRGRATSSVADTGVPIAAVAATLRPTSCRVLLLPRLPLPSAVAAVPLGGCRRRASEVRRARWYLGLLVWPYFLF